MVTEEVFQKVSNNNITYKCDECGKIHAVPAELKTPRCCDHPMIPIGSPLR